MTSSAWGKSLARRDLVRGSAIRAALLDDLAEIVERMPRWDLGSSAGMTLDPDQGHYLERAEVLALLRQRWPEGEG